MTTSMRSDAVGCEVGVPYVQVDVDSDAVVARVNAARAAAGLLTGHADGDEAEPVTTNNLLRDVETVFGTAEREASQLLTFGSALVGGTQTTEESGLAVKELR